MQDSKPTKCTVIQHETKFGCMLYYFGLTALADHNMQEYCDIIISMYEEQICAFCGVVS